MHREMQQKAGRAKTKLELSSQFATGILHASPDICLKIEAEQVADYALTLAEALLTGWEETNGLPNNVPKGDPNVPSGQ
jgi:hypothetical protein